MIRDLVIWWFWLLGIHNAEAYNIALGIIAGGSLLILIWLAVTLIVAFITGLFT